MRVVPLPVVPIAVFIFVSCPSPSMARTDFETSAPVDIVSKESIGDISNVKNFDDLLQITPHLEPSNSTLTSKPVQSDSKPLTLRGLESIEVLRHNSMTNYGSSLGGVVNLANYRGVRLPAAGGGGSGRCSITPAQNLRVKDTINWSGFNFTAQNKAGDLTPVGRELWESFGFSLSNQFQEQILKGPSPSANEHSSTPSLRQAGNAFSVSDLHGTARNGLQYDLRLINPVNPYKLEGESAKGWNQLGRQPMLISGFPHYGEFLSDERLGEAAGIGGPIISCGTKDKQTAVHIFDAGGVPIGSLTRQQIRTNPSLTMDYLKLAEGRSLGYQMDHLRDFSNGLTYTRRSQWDQLPSLSPEIGRNYAGFKPQSVFMPQLGMTPGDMETLAGTVNHQLLNGADPNDFFDPMHCCGAVYLDEPAYNRNILKAKETVPVVPNDPLYFNQTHEQKARRKKEGSGVILGSTLKFRGMTLGGGAMEDRTNKGPDVVDQWGIRAVGYLPKSNADSAWNSVDVSGKNVLVAVIDSGLDTGHPDAPEFIWTNPSEVPDNGIDDDADGYIDDVHGWNFLENSNDLRDFNGHGTNVAGIIAAKANNGLGIAGINPGAEIMVLKVVDPDGHTDSLTIYRALRYAADHGARIINISLGDQGASKLEQLGINYAHAKGALIVVAAGNKNEYIPGHGPASAKRVVTVGAQDFEGTRSTISGWGPNLAVLAPGEKIYTLFSRDAKWTGPAAAKDRAYIKVSGTSFAAPIVSATASLMLAKNPALSNEDLARDLSTSAVDLNEPGWDSLTGAGALDATAALKASAEALDVRVTNLLFSPEDRTVIDVFGSVSGPLDHFLVELGRGKNPSRWTSVGGPYNREAHDHWLCRIADKQLRAGGEWTVRISATGKDGRTTTAHSLMILK